MPSICISVVSHGQDDLVRELLESLAAHCCCEQLTVIVTRNIPDTTQPHFEQYAFPVTLLNNTTPRGFGANHNQAFLHCREDFFCVVNPDIVFVSDPFPHLTAAVAGSEIGVAAPLLVDSDGGLQDSWRDFPSPVRILQRLVFRESNGEDLQLPETSLAPDWVAGMFMLFPTSIYSRINGFDESYYMYCEDADICRRLALQGSGTLVVSTVQAIHDARRASHTTVRHLSWHISSLLRFFIKYPFYTL